MTIILKRTMVIGKRRTSRIMQEFGLKCKKNRVFKVSTTDSRHSLKKYPNLLLTEKKSMPTIVGDVTYYDINGKNRLRRCISLFVGAHLIDLTNREPIGIAISDRLDSNLVCEALKMAIENRGSLEGYIHHTDSDSRYCSDQYIQLLKSTGAEISMCVGNAYENAHAESFNATLKRQEINLNSYSSKEESAKGIFDFVYKYKTIRPHTSLGGLTPNEYREKYFVKL